MRRLLRRRFDVPWWTAPACLAIGVFLSLALRDPWYVAAGALTALCLTAVGWDPYDGEESHGKKE